MLDKKRAADKTLSAALLVKALLRKDRYKKQAQKCAFKNLFSDE